MEMIRAKTSKKLNQRQYNTLKKHQRELEELSHINPFHLIHQDSKTITDFTQFSKTIQKTSKIFESLNLLAHQLETSYQEHYLNIDLTRDPLFQNLNFFTKKGIQLLSNRNRLHFKTFEKVKFRLRSIFGLVEDYLAELDADLDQEYCQEILRENLERLRNLVKFNEPQAEKVKEVETEFSAIKRVIDEKIEFERTNILKSLKDEVFRQGMIEKRDKAVMTKLINIIETREEPEEIPTTPLEEISVKIDADELSSELMTKIDTNWTFITYSEKNTFLATLDKVGMSLRVESEEVYSKEYEDDFKFVKNAVFCKNCFYLYNYYPPRIIRKGLNSNDPSIWWDKKEITQFDYDNKILRATQNESAILLNLNDTELIIIEIQDLDGSPGREMVIRNDTGSRIACHEPLPDNRLLTVNKKGLITVFDIDFASYSGYRESERLQLQLEQDRNEDYFYFSICERSELCAILVGNSSETYITSRILLYRLGGEDGGPGGSRLRYLASVDLWEKDLKYYPSICFSGYVDDKILLFGHSYYGNIVHTYGFDVSKGEFGEKEAKELGGDLYCCKLMKNGDGGEICGLLQGGKILKIGVSVGQGEKEVVKDDEKADGKDEDKGGEKPILLEIRPF